MAEYIPTPVDWVREQIELYEGSGGTEGTTLRDTGLPVIIAEDPLTCVARGGGKALELMDAAGNADLLSTD